jgi:hypothetical protein
MKRIFYILLVFIGTQSCDDDNPMPGGPCTYNKFAGTAFIREIVLDTQNQTCGNAMFVYFDFIPDDPTARDEYRFPNFPDTNQAFRLSGYNPPSSWLDVKDMEVGSEFTCIRMEITSGTCTPYMFEFPTIDVLNWRNYCD